MKPQNELALIVGYYLSKMDREGYSLLGYSTFAEAIKKIGEILGVNKNTIKNMRDEFDPYHQNNRIGWKRDLRASRLKVFDAFQETDNATLLEIVREILTNKEFSKTQEYKDIHALFSDVEKTSRKQKSPVFILRGPTGKAAELFFLNYFKKKSFPINGELIDTRDLGCGYDFKIQDNNISYYVEVKGLSSSEGGVLFTNKEWQQALEHKNKYYLVIIKNVSFVPEIFIIQDPASKLKPEKNVYTTIQVNWRVSQKEIRLQS